MSNLKSNLDRVFNELKGLEERARKLKNQNLADVVASARGRVRQISEHPDLELLDEKKDEPAGAFDPKTAFDPSGARVRAIGRTTPRRTNAPQPAARPAYGLREAEAGGMLFLERHTGGTHEHSVSRHEDGLQ